MNLRERFLKIYSDVPLGLRKEIILVSDEEPLTWNAVYVEVFNNTEMSRKMLKRLEALKII